MKVKIRVEMNEAFVWWPVANVLLNARPGYEPTLLVDASIVERYDRVKKEFCEVQSILEELWRAQNGYLADHNIVSDYEVLEK